MSPLRSGASVAALVLMASLPLPGRAQPAKPASDNEPRTHRLVIENGPSRTVHYISRDLSPGEESALRDMERAENGLATAGQLLDLRRLYVSNELALERRRGVVNPLLYGYTSDYAAGLFPGVNAVGYGGFAGYPYGYPYGIGGFGNFGAGFAYPGFGAALGSATNTLAYGIGNEGVIKDAMARTLTDPSAAETYARAARAYDAAVARVADMKVGKDIGVVKGERTVGPQVTLTMKKNNEAIKGNLVNDDADWITVDTGTQEVTVRKADVDRITRVKSDVKPASR